MTPIVDFRCYSPLRSAMDVIGDRGGAAGKYVDRYRLGDLDRNVLGVEDFLAKLDGAGVERAVLVSGGAPNAEVVAYAEQSDRLVPMINIHPRDIPAALKEIQRFYDRGVRLVALYPWKDTLPANHRLYYPVYGKCSELGMAVVIHSSFHFGKGLRLEVAHPLNLDDVAVDFPDLVIVACHGGWPWMEDMIAVAWHNENVYIELSGWRNKYLPQTGSGWEMLFNYANGPLRDKVVWGSIWPFFDLDTITGEGRDLPFKPEVQRKVLRDNALVLLDRVGALAARVPHGA